MHSRCAVTHDIIVTVLLCHPGSSALLACRCPPTACPSRLCHEAVWCLQAEQESAYTQERNESAMASESATLEGLTGQATAEDPETGSVCSEDDDKLSTVRKWHPNLPEHSEYMPQYICSIIQCCATVKRTSTCSAYLTCEVQSRTCKCASVDARHSHYGACQWSRKRKLQTRSALCDASSGRSSHSARRRYGGRCRSPLCSCRRWSARSGARCRRLRSGRPRWQPCWARS